MKGRGEREEGRGKREEGRGEEGRRVREREEDGGERGEKCKFLSRVYEIL